MGILTIIIPIHATVFTDVLLSVAGKPFGFYVYSRRIHLDNTLPATGQTLVKDEIFDRLRQTRCVAPGNFATARQ